jgi:hypothetical protein
VISSTLVFLVILILPGLVALQKSKGSTSITSAISLGFMCVFAYFGFFVAISRYVVIPFTVTTASAGYVLLLIAIWFGSPSEVRLNRLPLSFKALTTVGLMTVSFFHFLIWNKALNYGAVLPNHDVYIHTTWVGNMARQSSLSSVAAYSNPISGPGAATPLYPFSLHALCAFVVQIGTGHASTVVVSFTRVMVCIFWPLGIFSLARSLQLKTHVGALAAAASTVALYNFPYSTLGWGGVAMVTGVILLTHCAAVSIDYISQSISRFSIVLGIAMAALLLVHTSEAFLFPVMVLVLGWPRFKEFEQKRLKISLLFFGSLLASVYPWLDRWIGNGLIASLGSVAPTGIGTVYQAVGQIVMLSAGMEFHTLWAPFILASSVIALTYSVKFRSFLYFWLLTVLGAFVTSQVEHSPWDVVSFMFSPWYRQFQRMVYLIVPAVALLSGLALEAFVVGYRSLNNNKAERLVRSVAGMSIVVLLLLTSWSRTGRVFNILMEEHSTLSSNDLTLPERVAELRDPSSTILASFDSGIGYWSADYGIRTTAAPLLNNSLLATREGLLDIVSSVGISEEARRLVSSLGITHIVTNTRSMSSDQRPESIRLETSENFDLVTSGDSVNIWRLREVVGNLDGVLSSSFAPSSGHTAVWALEEDVHFEVHNLTQNTQMVEVTFSLNQNICNSVSYATVEMAPLLRFNKVDFHAVTLKLELMPKESVRRRISFNSKPCLDPATGMELFAAISDFRISKVS